MVPRRGDSWEMTASEPSTTRTRRGLDHGTGFVVIALAFTTAMAFSTIPTPLYVIYQQRDGFPTLMVTVIFAAYAVGVSASLYLIGHVSDWFGRRRMIIVALLIELLSAFMFLLWNDTTGLIVARIVSGIGIGALTASATAHLGELRSVARPGTQRTADAVAGLANIGGLALGPLMAGLLAQYAPQPTITPTPAPATTALATKRGSHAPSTATASRAEPPSIRPVASQICVRSLRPPVPSWASAADANGVADSSPAASRERSSMTSTITLGPSEVNRPSTAKAANAAAPAPAKRPRPSGGTAIRCGWYGGSGSGMTTVSGTSATASAASASNAANTTKGVMVGAGTYCARMPAMSGPRARPPIFARPATAFALLGLPGLATSCSSPRWAVAAAVSAPMPMPETTRAAMRPIVSFHTRNMTAESSSMSRATMINRRLPNQSLTCPIR